MTSRLQRVGRCAAAASWLAMGFCVVAMAGAAAAADWPVYRHDNFRSGHTDEQLDASRLVLAWAYRSPQPPQPAWDGPAKWDAYSRHIGLSSMRDYDEAFHAIVVGRNLYFGSSADDAVHCLDTRTGREKWCYVTDGPVRIAPSWFEGRLYFGSDDGFAYCLRADDGQLIWKFHPADDPGRVINDGHLNSLYPVRTGVLVEGGTAYFGAALLPWQPAYLAAVDARTGKPEGPGRYVIKHYGLTMEGALLASPDRLILPQGRVAPALFERATGHLLGNLNPAGGGCFVLLTPQNLVLHGPGNHGGSIVESPSSGPAAPRGKAKGKGRAKPKLAQFPGGRAMVTSDGGWYLLAENKVAGIDAATQQPRWQVKGEALLSLILAGDTLFVGGDDQVTAHRASDGHVLWKAAVPGRVQGLAVADGALWVSTDEGSILCFRAGAAAAGLTTAQTSTPAPAALATATTEQAPANHAPAAKTDVQAGIVVGPYVQFTSPGSAVIHWETAGRSPSIVDYGLPRPTLRAGHDESTRQHEVTISGLRRRRNYTYQIETLVDGHAARSPEHTIETWFNYTLPNIELHDHDAKALLDASNVRQGISLVIGSDGPPGSMSWHLAEQSRLKVIEFESDFAKVEAARNFLLPTGAYGTRIEVLPLASLDTRTLPGHFANLIVLAAPSKGQPTCTAAEVVRLLRPEGGEAVIVVGSRGENEQKDLLTKWAAGTPLAETIAAAQKGATIRYVAPPLPGTGEWTHQYGSPSNASFSGETLGGAKSSDELVTQWVGRPGPRFHPDRSGRAPAPLAVGGRLFAQGLDRIAGIDQYNGTILWTLEMPDMLRMNMPRDGGNWCADKDHVYAVVHDRCWEIDAATGRVNRTLEVTRPTKDGHYEWGYVARVGDRLLGSAIRAGSTYTDFWGGENWYEQGNDKVCSDNLFALDVSGQKPAWTYTGGVIINSTLCAGGGRVYFVESRSPKLKEQAGRRINGGAGLWEDQYHVALDVATGKKLWERPIATKPGDVVFYQSYGSESLVLVASTNKRYYIYAFDAQGGSPKWQAEEAWGKGRADHGSHLSIPAIAGDRLYVRPGVYELGTGKQLPLSVPVGGCGTYTCTTAALFQRAGSGRNSTMWDASSGKVSEFNRLRPGCWLSIIPAGGMLLLPEEGGGCSCGVWLETSIGFLPRKVATADN